jgi:hypothetical protein
MLKMSAIGIRGNMLVWVNNFLRLSLRLSSCIFGTSAMKDNILFTGIPETADETRGCCLKLYS